jgi:hypothetical protein
VEGIEPGLRLMYLANEWGIKEVLLLNSDVCLLIFLMLMIVLLFILLLGKALLKLFPN